MNIKYVINGKFLSQKMTGVQRVQYELINELDKIVDKKDGFVLVMPSNAQKMNLKNIQEIYYGKFTGILWEQINLYFFQKKNKALGINLGNVAPFLKPDIVCVHDMNVKANPRFYSLRYRLWNNMQFHNIFRNAKKIVTVSDFSANEIKKYYPGCKISISVIKNAWQHFNRIKENNLALEKYGLKKNEYYFSLSSLAPNKNFKWIEESAKRNTSEFFVVGGMIKKSIYGNKNNSEEMDNIKYIGYISDSDAKCLMINCKAFVFPTLYEGFGIPPLEALSVGANVIVSDTVCMHEIFEDSVTYIDPYDYSDISNIKFADKNKREKILNKYDWNLSAHKLLNLCKETDKIDSK